MSRIGLQMYTLRDFTATKDGLFDTLAKVSRIGYKNIQTRTPQYMTAKQYKAELDKLSLCADSVFSPYTRLDADFAKNVDEAHVYGIDIVRTDSIPEEQRTSKEGYQRFAEAMNKLGDRYRREGLKLMYHFHSFEFISFGDTRGIDVLLNETEAENLYFMPDVFWLHCAGTEPSSSLYMFKNRAPRVHFKDYAITALEGRIEGVPCTQVPVGRGNLNWQGILKACSDIGVEQFVVEQDFCVGDAFVCVEQSLKGLNAMGID